MTCSVPDCPRDVRYKARRLCATCYKRLWKRGLLPIERLPLKHGPDKLEDLRDLDEMHVGANEAASRLGFPTAEALERWLYRKGQAELWLRLKARDPLGYHSKRERRRAS